MLVSSEPELHDVPAPLLLFDCLGPRRASIRNENEGQLQAVISYKRSTNENTRTRTRTRRAFGGLKTVKDTNSSTGKSPQAVSTERAAFGPLARPFSIFRGHAFVALALLLAVEGTAISSLENIGLALFLLSAPTLFLFRFRGGGLIYIMSGICTSWVEQ